MNILYIGPNDSEWAQTNRPVSLAAAKWARGFLTALSKHCNLTVLTHTYEVAWPKGKVLWRKYDVRLYPADWPCEAVSYPVLKFVREWWWRFAYASKAKRIVREKKIEVVLIYNCHESWKVPVLRGIKEAYPLVKIYPIILDGDDPRKDNWGWLKKAAVYSDGFIPLSWWVHQNITTMTGMPSYHMDGGADGWCGRHLTYKGKDCKAKSVPVTYSLVHTGALDQWRGLHFMTAVVKMLTLKRHDVKFIFCGKTSEMVLKKTFGSNPAVELPGFVSEERMEEICNHADVLLNVRDPKHPDNILNYPSKLPHYLSFGRPVVSTRLQSLSPDYADVVHFAVDDTVEGYARALEEVLGWDEDRKQLEYMRIKDWFEKHKRWDVLVQGVMKWIEG